MCFFWLLPNIHIDRDFPEMWIQGGRNVGVGIIYFARKFLNFGNQNLEIINIRIISKGLC